MKRYFIEEANCGVSEGGMACGPMGGSVVAAIKVKADGESKWLTMVETAGIPDTFLTDKNVYENLINEDIDDDLADYLREHHVGDFDDLYIGGEFCDILESITENPEHPAVPLVRYLLALVRCDMEGIDPLVEMAKGKYIDELDIPVSDIEEEYLANLEEEEE